MQAIRNAFAHGNEARIGDARMHAHGRLEVGHIARLGTRMEPVERKPATDHVEMHVGIAVRRRRIGGMHDSRIEPCSLHALKSLDEMLGLDLHFERVGIIGSCEMRERALELECTMETDLVEKLNGLVETHADAVHARVHCQMVRSLHAVQIRGFRIGYGVFRVVDRGRHVIAEQERNRRCRRLGQNKNRCPDTRLTQLHGFVDVGNGQTIGTCVQHDLRHLRSTMAVAIGFHDSHQTRARTKMATHVGDVVADGAQIDFGPGPSALGRRQVVDAVEIERKLALHAPSRRHVARVLERPIGRR